MDFASQIKSSVDIIQVIGERVRLQRSGANAYKGLCPFHQEKTPSFNVRADRQYFHCFGCQKSGSVIDFVMELDGLTFWEACLQLAERWGIPVPRRTEQADEKTRLRAGIYEAHELALKLFQAALWSGAGAEARAYLQRRGVTKAMIEEFGLGLADRGGQALTRRLQQAGWAPPQLQETGLVMARADGSGHYDRFRGRLMFPIHSETGKVIAFAGRALAASDEPKYLNSPETELYRKSYLLYNLHRARKAVREAGHFILVEGYMDVIGLFGGGVGEAVASCGTALVNTQARLMARHADAVVVNFDPDAAGASGAERSVQILLEEGLRIRVLTLPGGLDPDEYIQQHGAEAYRGLLQRAPRYFDWLADRARARFDFRTAEGRVDALKFLLPAIHRLPDKIERAAVANDLASYLGLDPGLILEQFRRSAAQRSAPAPAAPPLEVPAGERLLIKCLLESREARQAAIPLLGETDFLNRLVTYRILAAIAAAGVDPSWDDIAGRLTERDREILARIDAQADTGRAASGQEWTPEYARACLEALRTESREAEYLRLKERIKAAEKAGNLSEAIELSRELSRLAPPARRPANPEVE